MAVTTAYDGLAREWDAPPGVVYRLLARSLVAASPVALAGCLVFDVYGSAQGWPAVVADVLALPLRGDVFDAAVGVPAPSPATGGSDIGA